MKVVLIGSGNVAFHLAKAFHQNHFPLVQLVGRNTEALQEMHTLTGFAYTTDFAQIKPADLYIISVKDDAISSVAQHIPTRNALVVHTAGSVSYSVIPSSFRRGVLYPLQSFSKGKNLDYKAIPLFVEVEQKSDEKWILDLAKIISPKVTLANEQTRGQLHLAAVFACNFTNHLFTLANDICLQSNIPFDYLHPLIFETMNKIQLLSPKDAQTGPAIRNDQPVIQKQYQTLSGNPQKIYQLITQSIIEYYHNPKTNKE